MIGTVLSLQAAISAWSVFDKWVRDATRAWCYELGNEGMALPRPSPAQKKKKKNDTGKMAADPGTNLG